MVVPLLVEMLDLVVQVVEAQVDHQLLVMLKMAALPLVVEEAVMVIS